MGGGDHISQPQIPSRTSPRTQDMEQPKNEPIAMMGKAMNYWEASSLDPLWVYVVWVCATPNPKACASLRTCEAATAGGGVSLTFVGKQKLKNSVAALSRVRVEDFDH